MLRLMKPKKYITMDAENPFVRKIFDKSRDYLQYDGDGQELVLAYTSVGERGQGYDGLYDLLRLLKAFFSNDFGQRNCRMTLNVLNQLQLYLKYNWQLIKNRQMYQNLVQLCNDIVSGIGQKEGLYEMQTRIQQQINEIEDYYARQKMPADRLRKKNWTPERMMRSSKQLTRYSVNVQTLRMLARNCQYMDVLLKDADYRRLITDNAHQVFWRIMTQTWTSAFLEKINGEQKSRLEQSKQELEIYGGSKEEKIREYIDLAIQTKALSEEEIKELNEAWLKYKEEINQVRDADESLDGVRNAVVNEVKKYLETAEEDERNSVKKQLQTNPVLVRKYADYFIKKYAGQNSEEWYQALAEHFENKGDAEFSKFIRVCWGKDAVQKEQYLNECSRIIQMQYEQFALMNRKENHEFAEKLMNRIKTQPAGMPWALILKEDKAFHIFEDYMQDIKNAVASWQDADYQKMYSQLEKFQKEILSKYSLRIDKDYLNTVEQMEHTDVFEKMLACYLYDAGTAKETLYDVMLHFGELKEDFNEIYMTVSDKMMQITERKKPQIIAAYTDYLAENFAEQREEVLLLVNRAMGVSLEPFKADIDKVYMDKMSRVLKMQELVKTAKTQPGDFEQVMHRLIECEQMCSLHHIVDAIYEFEPEAAIYKSEARKRIDKMDKDMLSAFCEMIISTVREQEGAYTASFITLAENLEGIYYSADFQNNATDMLRVKKEFGNYFQLSDMKDLEAVYQTFFGERLSADAKVQLRFYDRISGFFDSISKYEIAALRELAKIFAGVSPECGQMSERLQGICQKYKQVIEKYMRRTSQWQSPELLKPDYIAVLRENLSKTKQIDMENYIKQYICEVQLSDSNAAYELIMNSVYLTAASRKLFMKMIVTDDAAFSILETMRDKSPAAKEEAERILMEHPKLTFLRKFSREHALEEQYRMMIEELAGVFWQYFLQPGKGMWNEKQVLAKFQNIMFESELYTEFVKAILKTKEGQIICREAVESVSHKIYGQFIEDGAFIQNLGKETWNAEYVFLSKIQESLTAMVWQHEYADGHKVHKMVQRIQMQNPIREILNDLKQSVGLEEHQMLEYIIHSLEKNHDEYKTAYEDFKKVFLKYDTKEEWTKEWGITYEEFKSRLEKMAASGRLASQRYADSSKSFELYEKYRRIVEESREMVHYSSLFLDMAYKSDRLFPVSDLLQNTDFSVSDLLQNTDFPVSDLLWDTDSIELAVKDGQNVKNVLVRQDAWPLYEQYLRNLTEKPGEVFTKDFYKVQPLHMLFNRSLHMQPQKVTMQIVVPKMQGDEYEAKYDLLHFMDEPDGLMYEIEEYQNAYFRGNDAEHQFNFALPAAGGAGEEYMARETNEQIRSLQDKVKKASVEMKNLKNVQAQMDKEFLRRSEKEIMEREFMKKIETDIMLAGMRHGVY